MWGPSGHERIVLGLVREPIERPWIEPGTELRAMGNRPVSGRVGIRQAGPEAPSKRVVDNLLERSPLAVDLIRQHFRHVRVERQGRPHLDIMMPLLSHIKMSPGRPVEPTIRSDR